MAICANQFAPEQYWPLKKHYECHWSGRIKKGSVCWGTWGVKIIKNQKSKSVVCCTIPADDDRKAKSISLGTLFWLWGVAWSLWLKDLETPSPNYGAGRLGNDKMKWNGSKQFMLKSSDLLKMMFDQLLQNLLQVACLELFLLVQVSVGKLHHPCKNTRLLESFWLGKIHDFFFQIIMGKLINYA